MRLDPTAVLTTILSVTGGITAAWLTASARTAKVENQVEQLSLQFQSAKVCSVYMPENWRDGTVVPPNWTAVTCKNYGISVGGWYYQLGCIYQDTLLLGATNSGQGPKPNCGW